MVQEAITNALKHARASRLEVRVAYLPDALELTIRDNGEGGAEDAVRAPTGHGLIGMRERVALLGGELEAGSADGGGGGDRPRSGAATNRTRDRTDQASSGPGYGRAVARRA